MEKFLRLFVALPEFTESVTSIGITQDCDTDPMVTFGRIQGNLRNTSLPVPSQPETAIDGSKRITVLLMPDCNSEGELETLFLRAVYDDPILGCVDGFMSCIHQLDNTFSTTNKAKIHAYLAAMKKPGLQPGTALLSGYLRPDSPVYNHIRNFVQSL